MVMARCKACGVEVPEGEEYCPKCFTLVKVMPGQWASKRP